VRRVVVAMLVSLLTGGGLASCSTDPGDRSGRADSEQRAPATTSAPSTSTTTTVPSGPRGPRGSGETVTFAFAGDTQFDGQLETQLRANPDGVLAPVTPVLSGADLAMVNLETAITERGEPVPGKNFHFRSPPLSFAALKAAGIDVANMANNHSLDYGLVGMQDTFDAIQSSAFPVTGIGHNAAEAFQPYRTVIKGQRIAILSAVDWLEPGLIPAWSATDTQPGLAFSIDPARLVAAGGCALPACANNSTRSASISRS
jgi:poly-gamma-glutamate synthesis protein (capsule biosynthesis protein)